ncbi:MAG: hypothetical protein R2747_24400 [Pyrinomonadaceae bacterium]
MGYAGEVLDQCGAIVLDCSNVVVVAVSGDGPNVCGHLLIKIGSGSNTYYFHVAEFHGPPRYMTEAGYRRYLREAGKTEIRRVPLSLPDPHSAELYLEELSANNWTWLVLPNNCVAFVEEVIHAGGGTWSSYSNCPSVATQESISSRATRFLNQLEGEIYNLYGVPRF